MKRRILSVLSIFAVAVGATACSADDAASEPVSAASDEVVVTNPISPIIWPISPITWDGTVGTWPLAVWASQPINWLAFDIPGATGLSLSLASMDGVPITGFAPIAVDGALVSTIGAGPWFGGLAPTLGLLPWANGLGTWAAGCNVPGFVFGLNFWPDGLVGLGLNAATPNAINPLLLTPTMTTSAMLPGAIVTPTLTSSALMFNTLPVITGTTPFVVNVHFNAVQSATMAQLNVFSSMAATNAAIQSAAVQSTVFPIIGMPFISPTMTTMTMPITNPVVTPIVTPLL